MRGPPFSLLGMQRRDILFQVPFEVSNCIPADITDPVDSRSIVQLVLDSILVTTRLLLGRKAGAE